MIKVYRKDKPEKDIYLKLEAGGDSVTLYACDENGSRVTAGAILSISKDGIMRCMSLSNQIGIKTSEDGRIAINE
jgi:hypothetical protein